MPPQHWPRAWKRATWLRRLSGLTSEPSALEHGVESWIASLRATRASPTVSPESAAGPTTTASSSTRCCVSSTSAGLIVCSERTSRGTRTDSLRLSSDHWSEWVTALRQESSLRPRSEQATGESGCSSWPTASVMLTGEATDPEVFAARQARAKAKGYNGNGCGPDLAMAAKMWPTARVERGGYTRDKGDPEQERPTLEGLAKQWSTPSAHDGRRPGADIHSTQGRNLNREAAQWPTPAARDHKGVNSTEHVETNGTGRCHLDQLPNFVEHCFSPPVPATPDGPASLPQRRVLSPQFVEWLMGWPIGWTDSAPVETGLSHWLLLMRGRLSTLCTAKPKRQADLFG